MKTWHIAAVVVTLGAGVAVAFLTGTFNRVGLGSTPQLLAAQSAGEKLPHIVTLGELGLTARTPAGIECAPERMGVRCRRSNGSVHFSVCEVRARAPHFARTPRTRFCDPADEEEGINPGEWEQERVGRATLAGFDGWIVSWWPAGRAKRGAGCSFRGYREAEGGAFQLLQVEIDEKCSGEALAILSSTRKR